MPFLDTIKADWKANKDNPKGQLILLLFRTAQYINSHKALKIVFFPFLVIYILVVEWAWGVEISYKAHIGKGLKLYHGHGLVVNFSTVMGNYCTLRQSTTIGNKGWIGDDDDSPIIGNWVDIGANVCIIGNIRIEDHVLIGAGSVVTKSIPSGAVVVGNPARIIKTKPSTE